MKTRGYINRFNVKDNNATVMYKRIQTVPYFNPSNEIFNESTCDINIYDIRKIFFVYCISANNKKPKILNDRSCVYKASSTQRTTDIYS